MPMTTGRLVQRCGVVADGSRTCAARMRQTAGFDRTEMGEKYRPFPDFNLPIVAAVGAFYFGSLCHKLQWLHRQQLRYFRSWHCFAEKKALRLVCTEL